MRWVFLSPHLDDVVLSCGGMVWTKTQQGEAVDVWTICAGAPDPQEPLSPFALELHERWGTGIEAVAARRREDQNALKRLGARGQYWDLPDCIYRQLPAGGPNASVNWLVNGEDDLWQPVHPQEYPLVERLSAWLSAQLSPQDVLISPVTLGNHVDHRLVRAAAEQAAGKVGIRMGYYADYPYVSRPGVTWEQKMGATWTQARQSVSEEALGVWQDAVACYESQLSTFFKDRHDLDLSLEKYWQDGGGACLWFSEPALHP